MRNFIFQSQWNWLVSGMALGIVFVLAIALVKPVGVSTQFVVLDGIVWNAVSDEVVEVNPDSKSGYSSSNAYLNKSGGKYAEKIANPWNYSFIFVLAMALGGFIARRLQSPKTNKDDLTTPEVWIKCFGNSTYKRHLAAFIGGILVLVGARLAGGCTSGHRMSGMMQTSISGYLFAMGAFAVAMPVAVLMYREKKTK